LVKRIAGRIGSSNLDRPGFCFPITEVSSCSWTQVRFERTYWKSAEVLTELQQLQ